MSDLLLTFYGDDFTGSTDVLEALTLAGVKAALFLEPPGPDVLRRFDGLRAAGVAGTGRAMTPARMDRELPGVFERLKALGAPHFHYKVCSTFDSSPEIGSVGRAIDLGAALFRPRFVPLVVGAPVLRRYCLFGNLFATAGTETFRLDRHPVMSRHPVTPMDEADLRAHLARQTSRRTALFDLLQLTGAPAEIDRRFEALLEGSPDVVLFDVLDDARLAEVGRLLWKHRPPFLVGSSGVEYALTGYGRAAGRLPPPRPPEAPGPADRLLAVSGSCSSVTEGQIAWALEHGFAGLRLEPDGGDEAPLVRRAADALEAGKSVVLYTARGPSDPAVRDARANGERVGTRLGRVARRVLEEARPGRLLVAGGDTSGYVVRQLGIEALEMVTPLAPGSPLCRARSRDGALDGLEIAMKGGQVGPADYFGRVLAPPGGAASVPPPPSETRNKKEIAL
jgi:uncharacterized protein YgbK (DUF1537 family)